MAILTDGQEWSFYLPGEQGHYDERRVYKLDLLERSCEEACERLHRYLGYQRVCSGEALLAARSDYQDVARLREMDTAIPKAWVALLEEQDSLLLELLAERVEDICGYKPDLDTCGRFIEKQTKNTPGIEPRRASQSGTHSSRTRPRTDRASTRGRRADHFIFLFRGKKYEASSAREVMTRVFQLLAEHDTDFLERFSARKHGRKRRYLARAQSDLYPDRPDLAEVHSVQISPGWWLGTNYSRRDIQKIIDLAAEVASPKLRRAIDVCVE